MSVLTRLWWYKQKATLRNLFRKPTSAIMTVLMVLLYGALIVMMLSVGNDLSSMAMLHQSILLSIGFTALIVLSLLLQKRKAMFFESDSFYLFCGPFSKAQVMKFLVAQSALQSFLFALFSLFMQICFGVGMKADLMFFLFAVIAHFLTYLFFLMLADYLYVLGIANTRYRHMSKWIAACFIAFAVLLLVVSMWEHDFVLVNGLLGFAQSKWFYLLPLFGWIKLLLMAYVGGSLVYVLVALGLLVSVNVVVYLLLISYQGDFYEQAMMDAIQMSAYMAEVKAGKGNVRQWNRHVHQANIRFRNGAGAIFSKNLLLMKKTRDFITLQDMFILAFYFVISLLTDEGFGIFCYMIIIWIFQVLQSSDLVNELKNFQIYLIPAKPFAKLWYALLPTLIKIVILMSAAVVFGGLLYRMSFYEIIVNWVMLVGYAGIFISGTVLSIRILKSRTNQMLEAMMRMLLTLLCALPGIIMTLYMMINNDFDSTKMMIAGNMSLVLNFVLSFVILFLCKNMMNGRELQSE